MLTPLKIFHLLTTLTYKIEINEKFTTYSMTSQPPLANSVHFYNIDLSSSFLLNWTEVKIASNINQHFVGRHIERSSELPSPVLCVIRLDTKPTAKQKCRLRYALMSKYCCDLKWSFDCNNTHSLNWIIFPAPCVNSALITSHHQTFAHVIILSIVAISRLT